MRTIVPVVWILMFSGCMSRPQGSSPAPVQDASTESQGELTLSGVYLLEPGGQLGLTSDTPPQPLDSSSKKKNDAHKKKLAIIIGSLTGTAIAAAAVTTGVVGAVLLYHYRNRILPQRPSGAPPAPNGGAREGGGKPPPPNARNGKGPGNGKGGKDDDPNPPRPDPGKGKGDEPNPPPPDQGKGKGGKDNVQQKESVYIQVGQESSGNLGKGRTDPQSGGKVPVGVVQSLSQVVLPPGKMALIVSDNATAQSLKLVDKNSIILVKNPQGDKVVFQVIDESSEGKLILARRFDDVPPVIQRKAFMSSPVVRGPSLLVNTEMTKLYDGGIPKMPFLADDCLDRSWSPPVGAVYVSYPEAFFDNLPPSIKKVLEEQGCDKKQVDIFLNIQNGQALGEQKDHADGSLTTRLKAHGWADPDAPRDFKGERVNRPFLYGIFDADRPGIADEVEVGKLKPFSVIVHDGLISPRTARIRLENSLKRGIESFWSVVIDYKNPKGTKRAAVTLHGFVPDYTQMRDLFYTRSNSRWVDAFGATRFRDVLKVSNYQEIVDLLNASPEFSTTNLVQKINALNQP